MIEARLPMLRRLREQFWSRPAVLGNLLALPAALLMQQIAFGMPDLVERVYSRTLYPVIAHVLGWANAWFPVSVAEAGTLGLGVWLIWRLTRKRGGSAGGGDDPRPWPRRALAAAGRLAVRTWIFVGWVLLGFLLLWGFNYARPPLAVRLGLETAAIEAPEVLELARRAVDTANHEYRRLGIASDEASRLPMTMKTLNAAIDASYGELRLPGDELGSLVSRAKPLLSSTAFAYLGISGIYVPFTGEPSFNRLVPAASLPITVAHEKAHQRGITDEGEANLAAALACGGADSGYLRYAGHLYMGISLIAAAARYMPDEAAEVWARLDEGPAADVRAIREFWVSYRSRATPVAASINDAYLRSNRVPGGVQSYGRVVDLLVRLSRRGDVLADPEGGS
ncbi:MAG TPA: DUF3810 domain-containing protein [Acidobacteriota bacterium]|nr:DUF3810 domain-containing protein [Acidobacteriota bacterium]